MPCLMYFRLKTMCAVVNNVTINSLMLLVKKFLSKSLNTKDNKQKALQEHGIFGSSFFILIIIMIILIIFVVMHP